MKTHVICTLEKVTIKDIANAIQITFDYEKIKRVQRSFFNCN